VDCTPWVTGGLWPAELSTVTAETAPLVKYLKADLQRIVDSANEELKGIRRSGSADSTRQAEEARVVNDARAFAVRRVESTVRHLHNMKTKVPSEYRPINGTDDTETTRRFKLTPARPDTNEPTDNSVPESPEYPEPVQPSAPIDQPDREESAAETARHAAPAAEPETDELATLEPTHPLDSDDSDDTDDSDATDHIYDSDDTEVLAEIATVLQEIAPLAQAPIDQRPKQQPVARPPEAPRAELPIPPPAAVHQAEPSIDETATARQQVPLVNHESEHERLERLLKFVARQEPGLRWAIGSHEDGTTLLVTDLAHGWIPPGLKLPADVRLLEPGRRTGTAAALLGHPTLSVTYAPGDPLGWATDYDVDTSPQPRELPAVDDLGWVLGEATHWRDGLPRMVNTMAKAGAAGTGILDAEIDILRVYLDTSRYQLLAQYPDIDAGLLLNCLLLAATEGIATKNPVNANYHFAWFHMLSAPPGSGWKAGP
jgi:hypothetical protein